MALDGFKLLHMHQQAAVAVEQHDGSIRARRRHPHGERDTVADRAELADGEELLLRARGHLRTEPGTVAARVHHLPVVRQSLFQRLDHVARVEQPRLDLEYLAVWFRIADPR